MSQLSNSRDEMKRLLQLMESMDYDLNDDELSDLEHEADEQETLMNKLYDIADEVERIVSLAEPELHVEPDVEQAHKYFLLGDYEEAANALLNELSDLRTSDPVPDPGYYGDIVYDMLMKLAAQHGHIDENDSDDVDYLDDEESEEEFESGDLVRFTDDYAEPDSPDAVYTLKDWDPVKGRGWAVDEDGQGWSVQAHQIQHAYVDESLNECGCDSSEMPAQADTQISYSKTHSIPDASVTVSASAKDHEQLQAVLRLAGVDADFAQAHIAEPEPEVVPTPQSPMSFGVRGDYSYSTDADFIRDQLRQRMKGLM